MKKHLKSMSRDFLKLRVKCVFLLVVKRKELRFDSRKTARGTSFWIQFSWKLHMISRIQSVVAIIVVLLRPIIIIY